MKPTSSKRVIAILILGICCVGFVGCSSNKQDAEYLQASNDANIKKMCNAYMLYAAWSRYTGPESKEEFRSFLQTDPRVEKNMKLMGIDRDKIDEYFVSENDGQEFDFRWGVFINPDQKRSSEPLVFEKEGKDGTRLVMLSNLKILEVDNDEKYRRLLKGKVKREEAQTDLETEEAAADFETSAAAD